MNEENSFLGKGWGFPPSFSKAEKGVAMTADEEDINKSLEILLSTRVGERIMQPGYGCNLDVLLFEPITLTLQTYIQDLVFTAIYLYEPRIKPEKVELNVSENEGMIEVEIEYMIRATNARHNLVYPFYLEEASIGRENI
jgi:phage baseplate assembly protein W